MAYKAVAVGILLVVLIATGVLITLPGQVKMRVDNDKTTLYVFNEDSSRWVVGGREFNSLFDGTSKMNRRLDSISVTTEIEGNEVTIRRTTQYIRGPIIIDTYLFKGDIADEKMFPIHHKVEILNGQGYFYRYEVRDLSYEEEARSLTGETELSFGNNVDVSLNPGYRWARVYKSGIVKAQYDIDSNHEEFFVRLFDPPAPAVNFIVPTQGNVTYVTVNYTFVNVSVSENADGILEWVNATSTNLTMTCVNASEDTYCEYNQTNLDDREYLFRVYILNGTNDMNSTGQRNITVDTVIPTITLTNPANSSTLNSSVEFNISLSETGNACLLSIDDGANLTMEANTSSDGFGYTRAFVTGGNKTFNFTCDDLAGNPGYSGNYGIEILSITCPLNPCSLYFRVEGFWHNDTSRYFYIYFDTYNGSSSEQKDEGSLLGLSALSETEEIIASWAEIWWEVSNVWGRQ